MAKSFRKERLNERLKELLGDFTVMGDEDTRAETKKGLESAKNFFRKSIGRELKLRQVPDLRFVYDDTLDKSLRIEDALNKIREDEAAD